MVQLRCILARGDRRRRGRGADCRAETDPPQRSTFSRASFGPGPGRELGRQPPARAFRQVRAARMTTTILVIVILMALALFFLWPIPISRNHRHCDAPGRVGTIGAGGRAYLFENATRPVRGQCGSYSIPPLTELLRF